MLNGRDFLPPFVLQLVGLLTFLFFCGFWAFTGRVEPALLASSGTLYAGGLVQEAARIIRRPEIPPADPPNPTEERSPNDDIPTPLKDQR